MTSYRTVADVTLALAQLLRQAVLRHEASIGHVEVTIMRPHRLESSGPRQSPTINVFLYHVQPTASLRNTALPIYQGSRVVSQPAIGLDLYYLLSFYGTGENETRAQTLLGLAVSALTAHPLLSEADLLAGRAPGDDARELELAETVAVTPLPLTIEELQRLWTMFPSVPYALSVSFVASSAVLVADLEVEPELPAHALGPRVGSQRAPHIDAVSVAGAPEAAVEFGVTVAIEGRALSADHVAVELGSQRVAVAGADVADDRLTVALDAPSLRAGEQSLRVLHLVGAELDGAVARASPPVELCLRPRVTGARVATRGGVSLRIGVEPAPDEGQRCALLLNEVLPADQTRERSARAYRVAVDPRAYDRERGELVVAADDFAPGRYLLRLAVDGAESLLRLERGRFDAPAVRLGASDG